MTINDKLLDNLGNGDSDAVSWINDIFAPLIRENRSKPGPDWLKTADKHANKFLISTLLELKRERKAFHRQLQELERNIPRVAYDLKQVERDLALLRVALDGVSETPPVVISESQATVLRSLQELRQSKEREETIKRAAEEAQKWRDLSDEMDGLLATNDFDKAVVRLQESKESLTFALGEADSVMEERGLLLTEWQEKVAEMLVPSLTMAIEEQDSATCGKVYRLLVNIDQVRLFEEYFDSVTCSLWLKQWSEHFAQFKGGLVQQAVSASTIYILPLDSQLQEQKFFKTFFDSISDFIIRQSSWLDSFLPLVNETQPGRTALLENMLKKLFQQMNPSFSEYLEFTLNTATPLGVAPPVIEHATRLFGATMQFVIDIEKLPGFTGQFAQMLASHFKPLQSRHRFYEEHQLQAQLRQATASLRKLQKESWSAFCVQFHDAWFPGIFSTILEPIVERSFQLTYGTSMSDCLSVIDNFFPQIIELCVTASAATSADAKGDEASAVQLLSSCQETSGHLQRLFTLIQETLQHYLTEDADGSVLRFANPDTPPFVPLISQNMFNIDSSALSKIIAAKAYRELLPESVSSLKKWTKGVQDSVFGVFMAPIEAFVAQLVVNPSSGAGAEERPSSIITSIGETLLDLPQKLERYASNSAALVYQPQTIPHLALGVNVNEYFGEDSEQSIATLEDRLALVTHYWLTSVVTGTMDGIATRLHSLKQAVYHFKTDVEYLGNVISSLEVPFTKEFHLVYLLATLSVKDQSSLESVLETLKLAADEEIVKKWKIKIIE